MTNYTPVNLSQVIQDDYLEYSLSVIIGRAIPSLTDGLKPVQRRILTAMEWLGLKSNGRYMKSARVEGETMGKLHPHSGSYGAMVTLAAPWSNNLPLIDGMGNWGTSVDGPAASRYTECKLAAFTEECILSNSETWDLTDNYDGSLKEPIALNVKIPLVLLNGQEGIGVGFATKIPPHNLSETCDAVINGTPLIPDFPTSCYIVNDDGLNNYKHTGIGTLRLRACCGLAETEKVGRSKTRTAFNFTCLPPNTNPEKIGTQIKDALDKNKLDGISSVVDLSDLSGDCIQVVAKPGTDTVSLLKLLYIHTDLETSYSARLLVIDGTKPIELNPSELITKWKAWRLDRLGIQFAFEQDAKLKRLEIVMGLLKAIDKLDAVIKVIRAAASPKEALIELVGNRNLKFTAEQARAILEMKLRSLTNLDSDELASEQGTLEQRLKELETLIKDPVARTNYMLKEVKAIGKKFGSPRRSSLIDLPPEVTTGKTTIRASTPAKPRFLKIDKVKGTVEQAKGPRGALILEPSEKLVTLTQDGTIKKVAANYKGTLGNGYSQVLLAKKESDIVSRKYLLVFTLEETLKAMVISGEDLTKVTSKGKAILPEGSQIIHFGEDSYTVQWVSSRKKPIVLDLGTKAGKPGGRGIKIGNLTNVTL
jgi:DNA gyrase subunit A